MARQFSICLYRGYENNFAKQPHLSRFGHHGHSTTNLWYATYVLLRHIILVLLRHYVVKRMSKQQCLNILRCKTGSKLVVKENMLAAVKNCRMAKEWIKFVLHGYNKGTPSFFLLMNLHNICTNKLVQRPSCLKMHAFLKQRG